MRADKEVEDLTLRAIHADAVEKPILERLRGDALERLRIAVQQQQKLKAELPSPFDLRSQEDSYNQIRESIDTFWGRPELEINALLFQLMGNRRLVVRHGEIVGTAEQPKWRSRY